MTISNPDLQLADEFVQHTNCNIFLTGKAGTGKTTFLQSIKKQSHKRLIVTAPTGVAAINAGGVTLHSFFQMPFGPYVPGSETYASPGQHRVSREKKNIMASLDLLVIDEISMVRADLLDCVDSVLRRYRRSNQPFGGVQLLMIGDLHQLSPVVKDSDWRILQPHYESPYFFSSTALRKTELVPIELKHIYRQSDEKFISLLNHVRDNTLDPSNLRELNDRHDPNFSPKESEGYITLCTHNSSADAINISKLQAKKTRSHHYIAKTDGDFPEHTFPTAASLELKQGVQVMFVRNDQSPEKLYFNGKIGTITDISDKKIEVRCPDDALPISVERTTWENTEYTVDPETAEISEKIVGTFAQYPLKLAWAITIHKSQGLTFDKAIIDAQAAFAHGQVYVALSRCRTLEGMVLSTPLSSSSIKTDRTVYSFVQEAERNTPSDEQLQAARIRYQQELLMEIFAFQKLRYSLGRLVSLINRNVTVIQLSGAGDVGEVERQTIEEICKVGDNFKRQLQGLFDPVVLPGADPSVLDRLSKASTYFENKIDTILTPWLDNIQFDTDNKEIRKKVKNGIKWLTEETSIKLAAVKCCHDGFSPSIYHRAISVARIDATKPQTKAKPPAITYLESDVGHPELFQLLKDWRKRKASEQKVQHFQIMHQKTLVQIAVHLPNTISALKNINGIGPQKADEYGLELVEIISLYRKEHNIEEVVLPILAYTQPPEKPKKSTEKQPKTDTKKLSLEMFHKGMLPADIAKERGLVLQTIEKHLAHFVEKGELDIRALVTDSSREVIEKKLSSMGKSPLREIKEALDHSFSYGEIHMVQAYLKAKAKELLD